MLCDTLYRLTFAVGKVWAGFRPHVLIYYGPSRGIPEIWKWWPRGPCCSWCIVRLCHSYVHIYNIQVSNSPVDVSCWGGELPDDWLSHSHVGSKWTNLNMKVRSRWSPWRICLIHPLNQEFLTARCRFCLHNSELTLLSRTVLRRVLLHQIYKVSSFPFQGKVTFSYKSAQGSIINLPNYKARLVCDHGFSKLSQPSTAQHVFSFRFVQCEDHQYQRKSPPLHFVLVYEPFRSLVSMAQGGNRDWAYRPIRSRRLAKSPKVRLKPTFTVWIYRMTVFPLAHFLPAQSSLPWFTLRPHAKVHPNRLLNPSHNQHLALSNPPL